jgi:inner membrane protein
MNGLAEIKERIAPRSLGVKLIVVCFLALLILIPALFVGGLVSERTQRAKSVAQEVSATQGGAQTLLGPTLAIPYSYEYLNDDGRKSTISALYFVAPATAQVSVAAQTTELHRSLFKVPVYKTVAAFAASFDLTNVPSAAPAGAVFDWSRAELIIGASDARGAQSDPTLTGNGRTVNFVPAATLASLELGSGSLTLFGVPAAEIVKPGGTFAVSAQMNFSGAQQLSILPFGKSTTVTMKSDWPNPGFDGGFLPVTRSIGEHGFEAGWAVPFIARGIHAEGGKNILSDLQKTALTVNFVELVDPYQSVERALKYVLLFVGMVFMTFFLFETIARRRLHPAQYILIGIAQVIFYLLLLSIAERIGFDWAFLLSAIATVGLIAAYAGWSFESRPFGAIALAVFGALYGLIYLLMRLEDQALLIGSLSSFAIVAAVMFFTRHIDWYNPVAALETKPEEPNRDK